MRMTICRGATILFFTAACFQTAISNCTIAYDMDLMVGMFPKDFRFGMASSAYQIEGATQEAGKGASIWEPFSKNPGSIADSSTADIAVDSYNDFKRDIKLLKNMGVKHYRISLSWSRILPGGSIDVINDLGVEYYNRLIDSLLLQGITPLVTLYHWDLPLDLENSIGGWLSSDISDYFADYANFCFKTFGDRVKMWATVNEPRSIARQGYDAGINAPGRCSDRTKCKYGNSSTEPYIVAHNLLLAHAAAVKIYRSQFEAQQNGSIGIALDSAFNFPLTDSVADKAAAQRAIEFTFGWFGDPVIRGDYPKVMRQKLKNRLPKFTPAQKRRLKGSIDFIGLNSYTALFAKAPQGNESVDDTGTLYSCKELSMSYITFDLSKNGTLIGATTASSWLHVVPKAIYSLAMWIENRYRGAYPIYVTENGVSQSGSSSISLEETLCDKQRVSFYQSYLKALLEAIKDGANVKGYYAWSLVDNWEWQQGYTERFGMHYVNFSDPARPRYPKASARWWKFFLGS